MKRGDKTVPKLHPNPKAMTQAQQLATLKADAKKLRKLKELDAETRCRSATSRTRNKLDTIPETSRTRSVSPMCHSPPLSAKLPRKRFYNIYSKIVVQLETVKTLSENKVNDTDNIDDLKKQLQRADEFSIRFSRNNLYETKRFVSDIKKLIAPFPFDNLSSNESKALSKKIILGYQAASQSLQVYINYVRNPANLEVPEKINELVVLLADLFLCSEQLSLPADEAFIQNDAVRICNELTAIFHSKIANPDRFEIKESELKKKCKTIFGDPRKKNKLFMYKAKLSNSKVKADIPKKKLGMNYLLGNKTRRLKKKDEKKARITHEIYTQKLNKNQGFKSKNLKIESRVEKTDGADPKLVPKRPKYGTPREVRSQDDDDVETMVQTIGCDEGTTSRTNPNIQEADEDTELNFNKSNFRDLLLEAIEELQSSDKKEPKATLKKLLTSIQNCSKSQSNSPRPEKVKVFYFKSNDLEQNAEQTKNEVAEEEKSDVHLEALHAERKARDEILSGERRLNIIFKILKPRKREEESEVAPVGKIKLRLSEDLMKNANKYRKSFAEYRRSNLMYKKTLANQPWELVGKFSDQIISDLIKEISQDFENDDILQKLFLNELSEVVD